MTKCELKNTIEKIRDEITKMETFENSTDYEKYIDLEQKSFFLDFLIPAILKNIEQETLFKAYKIVTYSILLYAFGKFRDIFKEFQKILENEIKRQEKQIKVLRTKLNVSNMEVLNPRKDLEQETLYYISVDKTQVSHNEYKLLKELGRDES